MKIIQCGCKKHYIPENTNRIVSINGEKWDAVCASRRLAEDILKHKNETVELEKIRSRFSYVMERMSSLLCFGCEKPLGHKFQFFGDGIYCNECMRDIGGES